MLGLDRKRMEEERLARQAKRKRAGSVSPPPLKRQMKDSVQTATRTPENLSMQFPDGVIKRTFSAAHPRNNDIKIEEVFQKEQLKTAVLSSYLWDTEWIFTKIDPSKTKVIFIMGTSSERTRQDEEAQAAKLGIKMCFAKLPQGSYSKMHSKLMLLFYDRFLRIVVPSANLVPYDWGETGMMENTVFVIDLPRRADGKPEAKEDLTFFGKELMYFLEQLDLWEKVREGVLNFDFSRTKKLAFVHSIAGTHYGEALLRTGFTGLGRSVRELKLESENLQLEFASASIGNLDDATISSFYHSCRGVTPEAFSKLEGSTAKQKFNIYFPTLATVRNSIGGTENAGTVCIQRRWWESKNFPRSMFRDYQSVRDGLLSHNKTLLARGTRPQRLRDDADDASVSWAYVGSANLSSSAWGRLTVDKQRKKMKLTCSNWESGVLFPRCEGVLDVPLKIPAQPYTEGTEPWYFTEHIS